MLPEREAVHCTYMAIVDETIFECQLLDFSLIATKFHRPDISINLTRKNVGFKKEE